MATTTTTTTTLAVASERLSFGEAGYAFIGVVLDGNGELFSEACHDHTHQSSDAATRCAKACRAEWKREWRYCYPGTTLIYAEGVAA